MEPVHFASWFEETSVSPEIIAMRLGLAGVFGLLIGLDREKRDRPAGLRTQMLVAVASAMFAIIAVELTLTVADLSDNARTDPTRLVEAVVAGVAFLGAGTIIQSRTGVKGITTGASLWMSGAIGLACGIGYLALATIGVVFAMFILIVLGWVERRVQSAESFSGDKVDPDTPARRD